MWKNYNGGATRRWKNIEDMWNRLDTIPACDGRTNRQTDILRRHSPRYAYASRGIIKSSKISNDMERRATAELLGYQNDTNDYTPQCISWRSQARLQQVGSLCLYAHARNRSLKVVKNDTNLRHKSTRRAQTMPRAKCQPKVMRDSNPTCDTRALEERKLCQGRNVNRKWCEIRIGFPD